MDGYIDDLMNLYKNEWWTNTRSKEEVIKMLQNTTFVFGLVNKDNELIAFSRVLSDKVYKAFIFDVIVRKDYRGQGLGEKLIEMALNHPELKNVKSFELYCKDEMVPFYEKFGFKKVDDLAFLKR
jgi:predicted GNAT family N-acyltransferase